MNARGKTVVAILLATVVALGTTIVVLARDGGGPPPAKPVIDQSVLSRTVPSLTASQRQEVKDISLGDARVHQFVERQAVEVSDLVVWTEASGDLIGGVATIGFPGPVTLEGEWLALDYDANEATSPPYSSVPYRAKYTDVTSLMVFVDLGRGQVVAVTPDHEAEMEGTPEVSENAIPQGGGSD